MEPPPGGEKCYPKSTDVKDYGLPPHGRGKVSVTDGQGFGPGITPAWAGKRLCYWDSRYRNRDHPRMGGEKIVVDGRITCLRGSPPHGRGKVRFGIRTLVANRITPAWAGKRLPFCGPCAGRGDHPRMGGEKYLVFPCFYYLMGSPPHGRGKAPMISASPMSGRITPAWAGKSLLIAVIVTYTQDHPRMGGEK